MQRTSNYFRAGHRDKSGHGFTLIELMIVIVIIAILAAIAIPSYQNSVKKSRRSDAQGALMGFANAMQRHFTTNNNSYLGAATGGADTGTPTIFPAQAPLDGATKYYNLRITSAPGDGTYTLRATPIGAQTGDGILELDSTGVRRWDKDNNGVFSAAENTW